ncbi:hypothetical protein RD1_2618 [Roseobacter denitrificans OCh 114]|uniref:Uncharacterized protein n=1 Tax=Roseobacter denitrificans (strain ATCC 33942 / OCh 114) TaxID=375451 RepID=Q166C5_ROSDO|nr:hypothetical protein RD1_2618 [Roseobacter denitrificans OCh 114]
MQAGVPGVHEKFAPYATEHKGDAGTHRCAAMRSHSADAQEIA